MDFWKKQGEPVYSMVESGPGNELSGEAEGDDTELLYTALTIVKERKRASATLLKGALHVSDGKAANLISIMETKGLIGPSMGSKPRDIYYDKIEELFNRNEKKNP